MSRRDYATDYVVHAEGGCPNPRVRDRVTTTDPARCPVTCKRCLARSARLDRELRRKSRVGLAMAFDLKPHNVFRADAEAHDESVRAIAREEGIAA